MGNTHLAIDIGASSGRCILGRLEGDRMVLEEVHRFANRQVRRNGHDCWDLDLLWQGILDGLKACKACGTIPATIGIDTWAVDFVLLDREGRLLGDAVAYRDGRTRGTDAVVERTIPAAELYARTGIQKQSFNTIYQLAVLQAEHPEQLAQAGSLLMIPDYFNYLLTGVQKQEYTNATSTGLVNARDCRWDRDLLDRLGLPSRLFGELSMPGTVLGPLAPGIAGQVGFEAQVVLPATHDTGSAFLAVPARDGQAVYLSSGTWSLLGVENPAPITTEASRAQNFTNEGGAWRRYRYLKNIMGLWMLQSIRREAGEGVSFNALEKAARDAADFPSRVDVNDGRFLAPENMGEAVSAFCRETGQPVPATLGELAACVYHSLAQSYAQSIQELSTLTGKSYTAVNIVGGGSQDGYLNQLTANATGLPVYAGPTEATALGNLMVQMLAAGEFPDLAAARKAVRHSFSIQEVLPC